MTLDWGLTEWKSILIAEAVVGEEGRHMDNEEGRREGRIVIIMINVQ